jgi:hypothetical protein
MGRPKRRLHLGFASVVAIIAGSLLGSPVGAQEQRIRADLDGRPIKAEEVSAYFCHDFDYPQIHCFSTSEALEASLIDDASGSPDGSVVAAAFGPSDYVTIYSGGGYSGSFAHLSQNYDALATIGWNDTISSYKARNSRSGTFYEHWFAGGVATAFCCNQMVPTLPSGRDNTFSSVYKR